MQFERTKLGLREDALAIIKAALAAVDPYRLVRENLYISRGGLTLVNLGLRSDAIENIYVIGAGKAGASMARAVEDALGDRVTAGIVVVKDGYRTAKTYRIEVVEAAHPIPDERGSRSARRILKLARQAGKHDLVICLLSGGGSALMTLPAEGLSLADIQQTTESLLMSGAPIAEINAVRKHLTLASGGRVALAAHPATVITLIISDVIGDDLEVIASGPTYPDSSTFAGALKVLEKRGLREKVPARVLEYLEAGAAGKIEETPEPKPRNPIFRHGNFYILGSNRIALDAAARAASGLRYHTLALTALLEGEAREVAKVFASLAWEEICHKSPLPKRACILAGGETTVTVRGNGRGGRAQEFALAAALKMVGLENSLVFAFGTDGTDGPTDAAGAFAFGDTVARGRALGLDPERHLALNDSYPFFKVLDDLIVTGPTGTNVNDIYGVLTG